jgi:hypothetical protein
MQNRGAASVMSGDFPRAVMRGAEMKVIEVKVIEVDDFPPMATWIAP